MTKVVRCVVCGKESKYKVCGECLIEREKVASIEKFTLEVCSKCNSVKMGKDWQKIGLGEAIESWIAEKIRVVQDFEVQEIVVYDKIAILRGILHGDFVETEIPINYKVHRISCPKCSMETGGYYESIVQLRAGKRQLREEEIQKAREIVEKTIMECEGDKDFISKFEIMKKGIDFYLGSRKLGEKISKKIAEELGGKILESKKLHTRIDGRDVYRFTFLVRLPEYEDMDVVVKGENLYVVKNSRAGKGIDLISGKHANITNTTLVAKKESFGWGVITYLDESTAEVMTEKGDIVLVPRPFGAEVGKEVFIFEYKSRTYAFPRDL
ncbi:MAG: NMD3-related protein [Archaeoglobaceae archaeon]